MAKLKTYKVSMLQGWRDTLTRELKSLGEIEGAGYEEGSTVWSVAVTTRFKTPEKLSDHLREVLHHDGWLKVTNYDWSEC